MRIVIDASALGELLLQTGSAFQIRRIVERAGVELHVPELTDIEIASILRGARLAGALSDGRLQEAIADYCDLNLFRHRHLGQLRRILALRHNFSAYDATYVALAEMLDASFLTADAALARAIRRHLSLQVFP